MDRQLRRWSRALFRHGLGHDPCGYQQSGTGTTSLPFQFNWCTDSGGNKVGGPGSPLTVTSVQVSPACQTVGSHTCSGPLTISASWSYVLPSFDNPCQTYFTCTPTPNGPVIGTQNVADGTPCQADSCHSATCQTGACVQGAPLPVEDDGNACTADSCVANVGMTHTFNATTCPPPSGATALDPTVPTSFANGTAFLYSGNNAIDTSRVGVVRGRVIDRDTSSPIPNIVVSVVGHAAEFGSATTRSDGYYDLPVNGGGSVTLEFVCSGLCPTISGTSTPLYVTAHRAVSPRWLDYTVVPDVALVQKDAAHTITPDVGSWQWAQGTSVSDEDGTRSATLIVPSWTHATNLVASSYTFRLTEATKGAQNGVTNGPAAMPADLPPQSGYTYAVELSADEADVAGVTSLTFNNTLLFYVDNFIGVPLSDAGAPVPSGSYNRAPDAGAWIAEQNGLVVKILGTAIDGAGHNVVTLSLDGSTEMSYSAVTPPVQDGEREVLYTLYSNRINSSFWRMPVQHFTPWDYNYAEVFPSNAVPPTTSRPYADTAPTCEKEVPGSIIECEGRILGETIPLPGTPFSLHYRSETQRGYQPTLTIPVTDNRVLPGTLDHIDVSIETAGRESLVVFKSGLGPGNPPPPNLTYHWTWDRTDAYGRSVQGSVMAHVTVSYVYNLSGSNVMPTYVFGSFGNGTAISHRGREARVSTMYDVPIGSFDDLGLGLGGWTLSPNHVLEMQTATLWRGDGTQVTPRQRPDVIQSVYSEAAATFDGLAAAADGTLFFGHTQSNNNYVARLKNGVLTNVTLPGSCGNANLAITDGMDATTLFSYQSR